MFFQSFSSILNDSADFYYCERKECWGLGTTWLRMSYVIVLYKVRTDYWSTYTYIVIPLQDTKRSKEVYMLPCWYDRVFSTIRQRISNQLKTQALNIKHQ